MIITTTKKFRSFCEEIEAILTMRFLCTYSLVAFLVIIPLVHCSPRALSDGVVKQRISKRQTSVPANVPVIECPKPTPPANGVAEFESEINKPGDAVKYVCNEGYTMIGGSTRHCEDSGRWRGERPTCEKLCAFPEIRESNGLKHEINPGTGNDLLTTAGNIVIREIQFECENGFTMRGSTRVRCTGGGIWDSAPPLCVKNGANVCSDLGQLENGERDLPAASSHLPGSVINFSCKDKFRLKGLPFAVCTDSGTWTASLPLCISTEGPGRCSTPEAPKNGDISIEEPATSLLDKIEEEPNTHPPNAKVHFKCHEWYELDGPSPIECLSNGKWSGTRATFCKPVCGKIPDDKIPFIINGAEAATGSWPWQVALTRYNESFARFIYCGGAVLNEMWIMTAAHCVTQKKLKVPQDPASLLLYFGKHYHRVETDDNLVETRKVASINVHPDYDPLTFDNDIAVVMLDLPLKMNDRIRPICLPSPESQRTYQIDTRGVVMGWGITEENVEAEELKFVLLPLVDQETCQKSYQTITVTRNMFCAGFKEGGQNTCEGDSGGPMGFLGENGDDKRYYAEGIVSWGNRHERGCANAARYGGFVRVCNFVNWIHRVITAS